MATVQRQQEALCQVELVTRLLGKVPERVTALVNDQWMSNAIAQIGDVIHGILTK
jgi:hypothetical protein